LHAKAQTRLSNNTPLGVEAARLLTAIDELAPENSEVIDVARGARGDCR